jgi:hypothetical protein
MRPTLRAFLDLFSPQRRAEPPEPDDELFDPDASPTKAERARRHTERRRNRQRILAEDPNHPTVEHIVDNRVFLLGLDQLYRTRMKRHESTELLTCAHAVAATLNVPPVDVPIEGYYGETTKLTEYFRLIRALQCVGDESAGRVARMGEFQRLSSVMAAPLYGRPVTGRSLLPVGRDPLAQVLIDTDGDLSQLSVGNLVERAYRVAVETEDFSLVGLASLARDAVVLAASRESVVLYAECAILSSEPPVPVLVWQVDDELARRGARFVATFNELFDDDLPEPVAENADLFFEAANENGIYGRCVCIAKHPEAGFYHWAVCLGPDGRLAVDDFWDTEVWTTDRYRDHPRERT